MRNTHIVDCCLRLSATINTPKQELVKPNGEKKSSIGIFITPQICDWLKWKKTTTVFSQDHNCWELVVRKLNERSIRTARLNRIPAHQSTCFCFKGKIPSFTILLKNHFTSWLIVNYIAHVPQDGLKMHGDHSPLFPPAPSLLWPPLIPTGSGRPVPFLEMGRKACSLPVGRDKGLETRQSIGHWKSCLEQHPPVAGFSLVERGTNIFICAAVSMQLQRGTVRKSRINSRSNYIKLKVSGADAKA